MPYALFLFLLAWSGAASAETPALPCPFLECPGGSGAGASSTIIGRKFKSLCCGLNRDRGYNGIIIAEIDSDRVRVRVLNPICCVEFLGNRQDACTQGRDVNSLTPGMELEIPRSCVE